MSQVIGIKQNSKQNVRNRQLRLPEVSGILAKMCYYFSRIIQQKWYLVLIEKTLKQAIYKVLF